jgi:hypothetical protein
MKSDVGNAAVSDIVEPSKYDIDYKDWRQQSEGISRKDFSNAGISSKSSHHHPRSWRDTTAIAIPGSLRHTVHPAHRRTAIPGSLRHTVHPVHKKGPLDAGLRISAGEKSV